MKIGISASDVTEVTFEVLDVHSIEAYDGLHSRVSIKTCFLMQHFALL